MTTDDPHDIRTLAAERVDALNATGLSHGEVKMELAVIIVNQDMHIRDLKLDMRLLHEELMRVKADLRHAERKLALTNGLPKGWEA